jgi:glucosamine--fructose-6-phosphate aminotransferase (isomerizing)
MQVFQKRKGPDVLCVSVYPHCELIRNASYSLVALEAEEKSVAQTRSFTSMFLLTQAAAYLASGNDKALADLQFLPDRFQPLVDRYEALSRQLAEEPRLNQFIFLGSGWNFGLACEAMLKMKEMSLSPSEAFHFLEFRHGPKSMVTPGTLIVGLLSDAAYEQEIKVLEEMHALGATVLAFVDKDKGVPADYVVELQSGLPDLSRAVLQLPFLQLMAFYRAMDKGLNPDQPANLEAVVRL